MKTGKNTASSKYMLSAKELLPLQNAFIGSKEVGKIVGPNQHNIIAKYCSSLICATYTVTENGQTCYKYEDGIKYILVTSGVPLLDSSAGKTAVLEKLQEYYRTENQLFSLNDLYETYMKIQLRKGVKELENRYGGDKKKIERKTQERERKMMEMVNNANKASQIYLEDCLSEAIKCKTEAAGRKTDFIKEVLKLSKNSTKNFDMEKYIDASIHFDLELINEKDDEEYFIIQSAKIRVSHNGKLSNEYCFGKDDDDLVEIIFEYYMKGNFITKYLYNDLSENERIRVRKAGSFLCADAFAEFWSSILNTRALSAWIKTDLETLKSDKYYIKKKAAGVIFSEIYIIIQILRRMFWHTEYGEIRFFTGNKKDPIDLESIITEEHKGKPAVTLFNLSENAERFRNFQCFFLDPFFGEDGASLIKGYQEYKFGILNETSGTLDDLFMF